MIPKFILVSAAVGTASLIMVGFLSWFIVSSNHEQAQRTCNRVVASRNDSRAMWIYLLKTKGAEDPKASAVFSRKLDELLPILKCNDSGNWVPVD